MKIAVIGPGFTELTAVYEQTRIDYDGKNESGNTPRYKVLPLDNA